MLILRVAGVMLVLGIGGAIVLWVVTGNRRYRVWAWKIFRVGLVFLLVVMSLFAIERVFAPMI